MASLVKGKQVATGADGIATANLMDAVLSADASGRAKIQGGFFNSATVSAKFAANSIADTILVESYTKADGTRAFTGNQSMGGFKLTNLGTPTAAGDAVTKAYADALTSGVDPKESVRVATAAALPTCIASGTGIGKTLTGVSNGALTIDGVAVVVGNRVLVKDQATGADNGIYVVTATGSGIAVFILTRATDADEDAQVTAGMYCFTEEGTANSDSGFILITNNPIVVDTDALTFTQFTGAGQITAGAGLTKSGNTLDVGAGNGIQANANDIEVLYGNSGTITTIDAGDTAAAGSNQSAARSDHQHAVTTGAASTASATTTNTEGSGGALARADHTHAVTSSAPSVTAKSEATGASTGTAAGFMRSDAQIQVATAAPGTQILSDASTATQGSASSLLRSDARLLATTATAVSLAGSNAQGSSTSLARADHTHARDIERQEAVTTQNITGTDTAITDTLNFTPLSNASVKLFLNGLLQKQGATFDYTISGSTITWLQSSGTAVPLSTTDDLNAVYMSQG